MTKGLCKEVHIRVMAGASTAKIAQIAGMSPRAAAAAHAQPEEPFPLAQRGARKCFYCGQHLGMLPRAAAAAPAEPAQAAEPAEPFPLPQRGLRKCICCGKPFQSTGPSNRMCARCRQLSVTETELWMG